MMFSQVLPLCVLALAVTAQDIAWKPVCGPEITQYNSTLPIVCGSLSVPLDYTIADSNQTLDLLLYKVPVANGTESKHSVLVNFGGPGNDGLGMLAANASALRL